jgi:hypothetical protein
MKVQMVIRHIVTGEFWVGERVELTDLQAEEAKTAIKDNIDKLSFIELNDTILPGDFIRNHCIIRFEHFEIEA